MDQESTKTGNEQKDVLTQLLGSIGRWQLFVFLTIFLVKVPTAWVQMSILFLTPNLTFWCTEFSSNTTEVLNSTCYKDCQRYEYDPSPYENTIVSEWDLVCERRWLASFTQTVLQSGILIGSILFGFLSDRYGRKYTFLASVLALVVFSLAVPYSSNYIMFTTFRFFLGVATAGNMVVSFVIVMESIGPKYREALGCIFHIPFSIGHASLALFAYYFRTWNAYTFASAVPTLVFLGYFFTLSESPRWLVSVGRVEEATKIVTKAAIMNNLPTAKVEETLTKMSQEIRSRSDEPKPNYSELYRKSLRLKTICCSIIWLITGAIFYGFNQYIGQTSQNPFLSVTIAALVQIPSTLKSIWLIKRFGRKTTIVTFFFLSGIFILALGLAPDIFWITLTLGTLGVMCSVIVTTSIYIYTSELYPTVVRNMGMGCSSTFMRAGSMAAPFISNLTTPWLPTVVFGVSPIFAGLICMLLPETKDTVLPDSLEDVKSNDKI